MALEQRCFRSRVGSAGPDKCCRLAAMAVMDAASRLVREPVAGRVQPPAEVDVLAAAQCGIEAAARLKDGAPDDEVGSHEIGHRCLWPSRGTSGAEVERRTHRLVALQPATFT